MTGDTHTRRPVRALPAIVLGVVAVLALAACSSERPGPSATVTVWVDPAAGAETTASAETPSAEPTSSQPEIPVELTAGHLRGAVRSYEEAQQHIDDARRSEELAAFRSPSGNIFCRIGPGQAACEVREGRVGPPIDGLCGESAATDVGRLELAEGRATPVCNTDSIRDPGAPKLAYGLRATVPDVEVTCLSEESGVTCVDPATEHGFFIARGSFTTF
jgi:hypothetical protein